MFYLFQFLYSIEGRVTSALFIVGVMVGGKGILV